MTHVYLVVEDRLSEAVGSGLLREYFGNDVEVTVLSRGGFGYIQSRLNSFIEMAAHNLVVLLTDLDNHVCAPGFRALWLGDRVVPDGLIFRIAVREVEAWLLADRTAIAKFLGIPAGRVKVNVEALADPKAELLRLARGGHRSIRVALLPKLHARSKVGLGYNDALVSFVSQTWSSARAIPNSDSLARACASLAKAAITIGEENDHPHA